MLDFNTKKDRHRHRHHGTKDKRQEEDKTNEKTIGELEEKIEDIEPMTITTMMKEEDHPRVPEATNDIEVAKIIIIIIIEDGTTVTHIQIHQKDRRYKSQYQ